MQHKLLAQVNRRRVALCMTDWDYLSQHPDGKANISQSRFSADQDQKHTYFPKWAIYFIQPVCDPTGVGVEA